jgi:hypothetical protein
VTPATEFYRALDELQAHDDFTRLSGACRKVVLQIVLEWGRDLLLAGNGAAELAGRLVEGVSSSPRLGDAAARATRTWAGRSI